MLTTDFGDAPDTSTEAGTGNYQTLPANGGPSHTIDTTQATLFLGARVDGEGDATQNTNASGDDITTLPDDEDGLSEPARDLVVTVGTAPVVRMRATNTTGSVATLHGWIDFSRDGVFDNGSERTSVTVPDSTTNGTFSLTFPMIPTNATAGVTYARFRLSTDVAVASSIGAATGGEVEDYRATITLRSDGIADAGRNVKIASDTNGGPSLATDDRFGISMASLGDLDGDGVTDLAVGADHDATGGAFRGAVYVQFMNANGTVKSHVKIASDTNGGPTLADGDYFGTSLASLGDVDGDGVTDLAVGAFFDDTGGTSRGAVHVLLLNSNGTVKSSVKIASDTNGGPTLANFDLFGISVCSLGDLDGDSVTDLAVGATDRVPRVVPFDTGGDDSPSGLGAVHVLFLNTNGTVKDSVKLASGLNGIPTLTDGDRLGSSVASLGDLDGDGITDLAVGAIGDDTGGSARGAVYVLLLNSNGTVKSSVKLGSGANGSPTLANDDGFGFSVASLGDLDGDGIVDLAVGADGDDTGGSYRGAMHVLFLNSNGTVSSSLRLASGTNGGPTLADGEYFGSSVASLGDLDGDGVTDLAVGARRDGTGGYGRGAVHVLFLKSLPFDFGDAPDSGAGTGTGNYQTLLADNGASHVINTTQTTLFLGTHVDSEANAIPTNNANGDDLSTLPDDENGLIEPGRDLILTVGTAPVVRMRATNTTGAEATLYGWVDFNRDGVFNNGTERTSVAVPSGSANGIFILTFPTIPLGTAAGSTYSRFRLSTDTAAANSTGPTTGGEVEDYAAEITQRSDGTADSAKNVRIASGTNGGPTLGNFDFFGQSVASIGDLDGDGVTDLGVGAFENNISSGTARGELHVLLMNANGTVSSSVKIASGMNGGPTLAIGDCFGASVASLGDLDGDGVTDLAVGARGDDTNGTAGGYSARGAVYVLLMNSNGTVKSHVKIASGTNGGPTLANGDEFGASVASLGDLDGDGVCDLAVGARADDTGGTLRGAVHVLLLNASGTVKSSVRIADSTNGGPTLANFDVFGNSLASLGDLDGDGVTDLAVGAYHDSTEGNRRGAVYVLLLNANSTVKSSVRIADSTNGGPTLANSDRFGGSLASLGDLDGDGVTELGVGALGADNRGALHVLLLNASGTVKRSVRIASGANGAPTLGNLDRFGRSVTSLGDLDGDGVTDLAVGAFGPDTGTLRGVVHVLFLKALQIDFGDAPDTGVGTGTSNYQTLSAENGPSHGITTTQTTLFLGAGVDGEFNASPNSNAHGDDVSTTSPDDEDGLIEPAQDLVLTVGTTPVVRVRATNMAGAVATLYGWIDFNRDGTFNNSTERTSVTVPSGMTNATFALTFPAISLSTSAGTTYARFRLSTDAAAANSTGAATGGEVEDYLATLVLRSDGTANSANNVKIASGTNGGPTLANFDFFGFSVASLGDLDSDGVTDLAVGAFRNDTGGTDRGAVQMLLLNSNGTVKGSQNIASGTGGGPTLANRDYFGASVASLGDLDGDGVTDLAVGATGDDTNGSYRGALHVLLINSNGTVKSSQKIASGTGGGPTLGNGDLFGISVASLGDLDGDGVSDLAVGAFRDDTGGTDRGAVYVLLLNSNGTVRSSQKIASGTAGGPTLANGDLFGISVASLGDLDGDGISDLAVGASGDDTGGTDCGAVYVLLLNSDGTVRSSQKIASGTAGGPTFSNGDSFGASVASLHDLDGDGVTDLAVGAYRDDTGGTGRGALHLVLLNANGTVKSSQIIASNTGGGPTLANVDYFGRSVASLGDLDGDGVTDLGAGAFRDDTGGTDRGAVHVLFLNAMNEPTNVRIDQSGRLVLTDLSGRADRLTVSFDSTTQEVVINDAVNGLTTSVGVLARPREVRVPIAEISNRMLLAELNDGDDSLSLANVPATVFPFGTILQGGAGNDSLEGGAGIDSLDCGDGNDVLTGGAGNDALQGGNGIDRISEAADFNIVLTTSAFVLSSGAMPISTDSLANIELADICGGPSRNRIDLSGFVTNPSFINTVVGAGGADTIFGTNGRDSITTFSSGADAIDGRDGNDTIFSGKGNDTVNGGVGNDCILGQNGDDSILGGDGDDALFGNFGNDVIDGGAGTDRIFGSQDQDRLLGGSENDSLFGDAGNDTLNGGAGNDLLRGSVGADDLDGGAGATDRVDEAGDTNFTVVGMQLSSPLFGTETARNVERFDLTGGAGANRIDARQASVMVIINGMAGNDTLGGGSGSDLLFGGDGNDIINGGTGNDRLEGGEGNDGLSGYTGNDSLFGQNGTDTLYGHDGADSLSGGDLNDTLIGGCGTSVSGDLADTLNGDADTDTRDNASGDTVTSVENQMAFASFPSWVDQI